MEAFTQYILISTFCLSILYLAYLIFQKSETRLYQLRYFLIFSILLSIFLPLSTYRIDLKFPENKYEIEEIHDNPTTISALNAEITESPSNISPKEENNWSIVNLLFAIYFLGLSFFGLRLLVHLTKIIYLFWTSRRVKQDNIVILNSETGSPFTFFNWIFIPNDLAKEENKDILIHERIHASQYHSIDLILIELLSAVMWFNPLVWMMKNSVQLVHEYLADEGVLNTGTDKLRYQALLLNQVAEERLICLSSNFNHSLIKKRMIMMTKSKFNQGSKLRIFALIPLATILFLGVACVNGQNKSNVVTAVEPVRMNVLYIGVDNPIKIAASGYNASDLSASIDNGTISGKNGEYVIQPKEQGSAIVTVSSNGKEIQKTTFRVKVVPDPVAKVSGKKGGDIKKSELMKANEVLAVMENFDFDLSFDIVEFRVSAVINGKVYEYTSNSNILTNKQKDIIAKSSEGSKIYFEEIKCKGPDGFLRKMPTIAFKITE
jgi:beta-lactamase regulating signal transducer with metallopeptidase domain